MCSKLPAFIKSFISIRTFTLLSSVINCNIIAPNTFAPFQELSVNLKNLCDGLQRFLREGDVRALKEQKEKVQVTYLGRGGRTRDCIEEGGGNLGKEINR